MFYQKSQDKPISTAISLNDQDMTFSDEVIKQSGTNIHLCWHCKTCAGGCPFSEMMDYFPNQIIRLVQLGMKDEALKSSFIWICVGCHTCSMQCPQAVDMAAISDTLRQMAMDEKMEIAEPNILAFHKAVMHSIHRYGRAHKLEIMLRYKLGRKDLFSDMDLGLKMMAKRKLDLLPSKTNDLSAIRKLFLSKPALTER